MLAEPRLAVRSHATRPHAIPVIASRLNLTPAFTEVAAHLKTVEREIRSQAAAFDPAIVPYVAYACESRGKRIRPALALLTGAAAGGVSEHHVRLATIVELIHLASLVHDDIMDRADLRRGAPTASAKWGPELAVLLGDCLFAHALKLCTAFDTNDVARAIAGAANEVCQGEILQTRRQFDLSLPIEEYFRIVRMKTAALFRVATQLGCHLAGQPAHAVAALREYGARLGVAYQIYDDCLDLVGTTQDTGKTLGTDAAKGKFTLPILIHRRDASEQDRERVDATLLHGDADQRLELAADLHASGAFAGAVRAIQDELRAAVRCLDALPPSPSRDALDALPTAVAGHIAQILAA